jgi:hypothetical protein
MLGQTMGIAALNRSYVPRITTIRTLETAPWHS